VKSDKKWKNRRWDIFAADLRQAKFGG